MGLESKALLRLEEPHQVRGQGDADTFSRRAMRRGWETLLLAAGIDATSSEFRGQRAA